VQTPTSTPAAPRTPQPEPKIAIEQPLSGSSVRPPFRIAGAADVFEGALVVQVQDASGKVLCERPVQATSGTGTPGHWETTMSFAPPKDAGPGTIRAFSRSAADGSEQNIVTRGIQISNEAAPVIITSPVCGAQVQALSKLDVKGTASVFEAALVAELRDSSGKVLKTENITASIGAPDTGTWQTTFDLASLPTGDYEVVAYHKSARDGSVQDLFSIPFRIAT
jgi:immunoglobulin-like protein involved in spore germination